MRKQIILRIIIPIIFIMIASFLLMLLTHYVQKNQRDVERFSDIAQIRMALASYFFYKQSYPIASDARLLGVGDNKVLCDTDKGMQSNADYCDKIFLKNIPQDPNYINGAGYYYLSNGQDYSLTFILENNHSNLIAGTHTATPDSIK